jgi:hypothetical protein
MSLDSSNVKPSNVKLVDGMVITKQLSCGSMVEIHSSQNGIKVLTYVLGFNNKRFCIGRRIFTEKDLTG